jgi:hypothetical protein
MYYFPLMSPQLDAAMIAASVSALTLIGTWLRSIWVGAQSAGTLKNHLRNSVSSWIERSRNSALRR